MGYLNNSSITVDAILTLKGRELLAKGGNAFNIAQFAVGDDEIDYNLWNPNHPLGTNYYGILIENMPITEAVPDETQALRYKLITLPKDVQQIPILGGVPGNITLSGPQDFRVFAPATTNLTGGNGNLGYTCILSDTNVATLLVTKGVQSSGMPTVTSTINVNSDPTSIALKGFEFKILAKTQLIEDKQATLTIIGNETGGSVTIPLTVLKAQLGNI